MKPLVLLHGWGVLPSVFDSLRAKLADRYEIHAPALPGYGDAPLCERYDLESIAASIASAAPERCFVAGWSLGGQVALAWAERAPRQVEAMALIATTPAFVQRGAWTHAMQVRVFEGFASELEDDVTRALRRFALLQSQGDAASKDVALALRAALAAPPGVELDALRGGLDLLRKSDLRECLHAIETRALVIHGGNDSLVPETAAEHLAAALPRATLSVLCDAGHAPFISNAEAVARAMRGFFA